MKLSINELAEILGKRWGTIDVDSVIGRISPDISINRMEQLGFWEAPDQGVSLALKDEMFMETGGVIATNGPLVVIGVHLYSNGKDGYKAYTGELPEGVVWGGSRIDTRRVLGAPAASGGGKQVAGNKWPKWDRYDRPAYSIRVQYNDTDNVEMVTLIAPSEG